VWANGQADLWRKAGLVEVIQEPIVISLITPISGTTGPASQQVPAGLHRV
jgi:hypothetical protein